MTSYPPAQERRKSWFRYGQRFSITDIFQKGRRFSRNNKRDSIDQDRLEMESNSNRGSLELEEFNFEDPSNQSQTDGQKILTMKDKDEMLQDLKKENFDLKLRLYMTEKSSETAEGKVGEYEQQLAALLNSLEDQQRLSEQQSRELEDSKLREKQLLQEQKKLTDHCTEQDEQIHTLSLNLSKMSQSMMDVTGTTPSPAAHSTPVRNAKSEYFSSNDNLDSSDGINSIRPFSNQVNISHVSPMPRGGDVAPSSVMSDTAHLVDNDRGVHSSVSEDTNYSVTNGPHTTKNIYYNTPTTEGRSNTRNEGYDNVGVVRPNNTRTVVDVEIPQEPIREIDTPKKKKKGIMRVFKLCTGKSGQLPARQDSVYQKRDARINVTTYTNE